MEKIINEERQPEVLYIDGVPYTLANVTHEATGMWVRELPATPKRFPKQLRGANASKNGG